LKTVERAATDTTSVHHVVENTDETPDDDETVMDWLRTIDADALEDVVNDLLAEHATTILDLIGRGSSSSISSITLSRIVSHPSTRSLFDEASRRNHQLSPLLYRVRPRYEETAHTRDNARRER